MGHILFTDMNISFKNVWNVEGMLGMCGCLFVKGDRIYVWSAVLL